MRRRLIAVLVLMCLAGTANAGDKVNERWQQAILAAIDSFPEHGGYYTGGRPNDLFAKTTWRGLHDAYQMAAREERPRFDPMQAQPSFCSSATYAVIIKALLIWDTKYRIKREAWINMKPHVGIADEFNPDGVGQDDGVGFWGRANANGPGLGVLVRELGAGYSFTAYRGAKSERNKETPDERYLTDAEWCALDVWDRAVPGAVTAVPSSVVMTTRPLTRRLATASSLWAARATPSPIGHRTDLESTLNRWVTASDVATRLPSNVSCSPVLRNPNVSTMHEKWRRPMLTPI